MERDFHGRTEPLDEDPYILIRYGEDYIVIYVDDMIVAASTDEGVGRFINELSSRFNTKILGEPAAQPSNQRS